MPLPDSASVHRAVEAVYRRPEYAPADKESLWDRMWEAVARGLAWLLDQFGFMRGLRFSSPVLYWAVLALLAAAALAIVATLVWSAVRTTAAEGPRARRTEAAARPGRPRTADDWDEEARRLAAEGRLREASVALYHALLLRLERSGDLRYDASKTPGDYRREVRGRDAAARTLTGFLRRFEPVAFGGRAVDGEAYEALRQAARPEGARG